MMDSSIHTGVETTSSLSGSEDLEGREMRRLTRDEEDVLISMKEENEDWEELNVKIESEDEEGFWKEEDPKRNEMEGVVPEHKFVKDELMLECSQQEREKRSMFISSCVLKQARVLIHRLEIANNSVAVSTLPRPLARKRGKGDGCSASENFVIDQEGLGKGVEKDRNGMKVGIVPDRKFGLDGMKMECGQQSEEEPCMLVTSCVLKQPRVLIHRLKISNDTVPVQALPGPMSWKRNPGVRSPWRRHELLPLVGNRLVKQESQVITLERRADAQSEFLLNLLPSSSENGTNAEATFGLITSKTENAGQTDGLSSQHSAFPLYPFFDPEEVHLQDDFDPILPYELSRTVRSQTPPRTPNQYLTPPTFPTLTQPYIDSLGDHPLRKKMLQTEC
ncbi:hypothetical protein GJAV_G00224080, partial [Gymnothorax javanicus]